MEFTVVGGGPSGLYFALLAKKNFPSAHVRVIEQNPKSATYGFGIVLADRGLGRFRAADEKSYDAIMEASFVSRHRVLIHREEPVFIEGGGYGGAIARLRLLNILQDRCEELGVELLYDQRIDDPADLPGDLIVGADGVNSVVRDRFPEEFGVTRYVLGNKLAWYGTEHHFPYPLLSFKTTDKGHFWAAAYAYTERMGTFVAECDAATWEKSGLSALSDEERQRFTEELFADELGGQPLIANKSLWHSLPVIRVKNWSVGRHVLIGDALHSAHPTIGSGTRIAMEDSIALIDALRGTNDIASGLAAFREQREPTKQKLVVAAEKSFTWYEDIGERLDGINPVALVFDFMTRTGRVDRARLEAEYPYFMKKYGDQWKESAAA